MRVIRVTIPPGGKENLHTHIWPSIFTVMSFPDVNYCNEEGEVFRSPAAAAKACPLG